MTYTPKSWGNDPVGGTPLNATGLNDWEARIEFGIDGSGPSTTGLIYAYDHGVRGDNSTDNLVTLQAAIDAALVSAGGVNSNTVMLPRGVMLVSNQIKVKNGVRLLGDGKGASSIKAAGAFPINTPVVRLGDSTGIVFQCRLEYLNVHCNNISGSTGVYSTEVQEGSGLLHVGLFGHDKYGAEFDGAGCSQFALQELEVYCGVSGADKGLYLHGSAGTNTVEWVTLNCAGRAASVGLHVTAGNYNLKQIHAEQCTDGISFAGGAGLVDGLLGSADVTNLLHIGGATSSVTARNIDRNGSPNTLVDDFTGQTFTDSNIAEYVQQTLRVGYITLNDGCVTTLTSSTGGRRNAVTMGQGAQAYDFTLHKPIWSDGTNWRDASGAVV